VIDRIETAGFIGRTLLKREHFHGNTAEAVSTTSLRVYAPSGPRPIVACTVRTDGCFRPVPAATIGGSVLADSVLPAAE
jgi:hypothetical protein